MGGVVLRLIGWLTVKNQIQSMIDDEKNREPWTVESTNSAFTLEEKHTNIHTQSVIPLLHER